jgi:hypothetical protein
LGFSFINYKCARVQDDIWYANWFLC